MSTTHMGYDGNDQVSVAPHTNGLPVLPELFGPGDLNENCYPPDTIPLENQVAGHSYKDGKNSLGMLRHKDGYVLKPVQKPVQGECEINFYRELQQALDPVSAQLRVFVPEFLGVTMLKINNIDVRFLVLKDVTEGVSEPCIMDIKIGRQTWDPTATAEKRQAEESKYQQSKHQLGFCIPGLQVYNTETGKITKLGKEDGKQLNKDNTKDAFKLFLNAQAGLNRHLVLQFLSKLWCILRWCRTQRKYKFYASSLLLVYSSRKLKRCLKNGYFSNSSPGTPLTLGSVKEPESPGPSTAGSFSFPTKKNYDGWCFDKIIKNHSLVNNYEKDLQTMKENYPLMLDKLLHASEYSDQDIAIVKMIDFAHAFPSNGQIDSNYINGLENVVKIFESLYEEAV